MVVQTTRSGERRRAASPGRTDGSPPCPPSRPAPQHCFQVLVRPRLGVAAMNESELVQQPRRKAATSDTSCRNASSSRSDRPTPTTANSSGSRLCRARFATPGNSFRRARSPDAPKITSVDGGPSDRRRRTHPRSSSSPDFRAADADDRAIADTAHRRDQETGSRRSVLGAMGVAGRAGALSPGASPGLLHPAREARYRRPCTDQPPCARPIRGRTLGPKAPPDLCGMR